MRAVKCAACFDLSLLFWSPRYGSRTRHNAKGIIIYYDLASSGITKVIGFFMLFFVALAPQHPFNSLQCFSYPVLGCGIREPDVVYAPWPECRSWCGCNEGFF